MDEFSNLQYSLKNVFKPPILHQIAVQGSQIKDNFKPVRMTVSELMHTGRKIGWCPIDLSITLISISDFSSCPTKRDYKYNKTPNGLT